MKIPASRWTSAGLALAGTAALALVVPALGDPPAFSGPAIYPFAFAPTRDVAPDLNNDGRPDLAVANASAETKGAVGIYLSRADGVLQRQPDTALAHFESFGLAAADLNKDGNVDLAVTNGSGGTGENTVTVIRGNGDGSFQAGMDYATGGNPQSVAIADPRGLTLSVRASRSPARHRLPAGSGLKMPSLPSEAG